MIRYCYSNLDTIYAKSLLEKTQTSITVVVKKLDFFKSVTPGRSINGIHFDFY